MKSCTEKEEGEEKFKFKEVYVKTNIYNYPSKKNILTNLNFKLKY